MTVSCIIPAWNEAATIGALVDIAAHHPLISEVIVVDDGSTDSTANIARTAGATVIRNNRNIGKAQSMDRGVAAARNDMILFLDADLKGLTADHLTNLINPIVANAADMTIAIRDRGGLINKLNAQLGPWIAGERCLPKSLWGSVPAQFKKGFQIELALNHYARSQGLPVQPVFLPGLSIRRKEQKMGLARGLLARITMIGELIQVSLRLLIRK
ncbi:glycosyltransferase [Candidatus Uhrbacteria bacterium]|nr:glycosyltransferase [Candidatus Uhrbacteria bacterium]